MDSYERLGQEIERLISESALQGQIVSSMRLELDMFRKEADDYRNAAVFANAKVYEAESHVATLRSDVEGIRREVQKVFAETSDVLEIQTCLAEATGTLV